MDQKRVLLEHLHNMRDLGGCPTTEKKVTKWNLLYRCDAPASLTDEEWNVLKSLNITMLIDLRSDRERESTPIIPGYPLAYHEISLMKELDEAEEEAVRMPSNDQEVQAMAMQKFMKSMELDYTRTVFGNPQGAAQTLDLIMENLKSGGSTLFFCSAGKDRTGIIAALILYLCHVPREDIIADYMVSSTYNSKGINQLLGSMPREWMSALQDNEMLRKSLDSAPETMADLLDSFESKDIRGVLEENGFGKERQKELEELMTESCYER